MEEDWCGDSDRALWTHRGISMDRVFFAETTMVQMHKHGDSDRLLRCDVRCRMLPILLVAALVQWPALALGENSDPRCGANGVPANATCRNIVAATYAIYEHTNCYPGHGATDITGQTDDRDLTVQACQTWCDGEPACTGFTKTSTSNHTRDGKSSCWLKSNTTATYPPCSSGKREG